MNTLENSNKEHEICSYYYEVNVKILCVLGVKFMIFLNRNMSSKYIKKDLHVCLHARNHVRP